MASQLGFSNVHRRVRALHVEADGHGWLGFLRVLCAFCLAQVTAENAERKEAEEELPLLSHTGTALDDRELLNEYESILCGMGTTNQDLQNVHWRIRSLNLKCVRTIPQDPKSSSSQGRSR